MGNETATATRRRYNNKNSFSVDFGHQLPSKIKPTNNTLKLIPISDPYTKDRSNLVTSPNKNNNNDDQSGVAESEIEDGRRMEEEGKKESSSRLQKLNSTNDQLRKELIRISSELTERLKKKKFQVKKVQQKEINPNKKQSLKKELQNAYKQIDMYKKLLYDLKVGESSGAKLLDLQDKISSVDIEIEKTMVEIQAVKNVTSNQSAGIRKDKGWEALEELKGEVQGLKVVLKEKSKEERVKEKKYMQQHHYMKALQQKLKQIEKQQEEAQKEAKGSDKPSQADKKLAEQQLQLLKQKHDDYHKKINSYLLTNKALKQTRKELKSKLQQTVKIIEGLRYKRDALVKQIKDNLHLFATTQNEEKEEELSEFQTEQEEEPDPIQEEEDERGTFDVEHLKDHQLKQISKEDIIKKKEQKEVIREETQKAEPKLWRRQLTRIISKGKQQPEEKSFSTGLTVTPKIQIKIIKMSVWMNKKKQITAIQTSYMVDGRILDGSKSSKNAEDQYRVTFELEQHDFLKSVLGIFGRSGFLEYLVLQSNFGKVSKIGRQQTDGDNFAIGVAKEETPVQITGANSQDGMFWRINRLDFEVLIETGN